MTEFIHTDIQLTVPDFALRALEVLEQGGHSAYIVGGWVRDALMGRVAQDVDISTSALWDQTASCFRDLGYSVYETGTQHGTVSVIIDGNIIEITTFRTESTYEDGRHPDAVEFVDSVELDLHRRDFTVNAMAYNPRVGLIDLFGGIEDIAHKTLKCVGDPSVRFEEDALRILRAVRFATRLGFDVDQNTRDALLDSASKLNFIAKERIGLELSSIISSGKLSAALREFPEVMVVAIPELEAMVGFDQRSQYHAFDCMEHTIRVVEGVEVAGGYPSDILRWAALWHDMAKPQCLYVDEEGQGHFPDHPAFSARMARSAMRRMALPSELITLVAALIEEHDEPIEPTHISMVRMLQRLSGSGVKNGSMAYAALYLRQADALAKAVEYRSYVSELDACKVCLQEVLALKFPVVVTDLAIGGKDVIEVASVKPGPCIGDILTQCLEEVIQGRVGKDRASQLAWVSGLDVSNPQR